MTSSLKHAPQRSWQARQDAAGRCINCGKERGDSPYKRKCRACGPKPGERQRARLGARKWEAGRPGRKPLTEVGDEQV